jgi:hypothetical protein
MLACTDQFTQKTAEAKTKNPLEQNSSRRGFIFPEKWIFGAKGQRASSSFIATMPKATDRPVRSIIWEKGNAAVKERRIKLLTSNLRRPLFLM